MEWTDRFTGAYATPELVGRTDLIAKITKVLQRPGHNPQAVMLTGLGGMGKTRLINQILQDAAKLADKQILLAAPINVDAAHIVNHTRNGLAESLYRVLTPPAERFSGYLREHRILERMWLAGEVGGVNEQLECELAAFSDDMKSLASKQRVVLALDTAERLVYGVPGKYQAMLDVADSWEWLLEALPQWGNVVLLLAGRPGASPLLPHLKQALGDRVEEIEVGPFSFEESQGYFEAVAQAAVIEEPAVATRLRSLTPDMRHLIHIYAGGKPILLALLADILISAEPGRLPGLLLTPLAEAKEKTPAELDAIRELMEKELITRLRETPSIGDTILALGRLPKGADSNLLSSILGVNENGARRLLEEVQRYSFVKVRPSDDRVFLHDEMYALLQRQAYSDPGDAPEAERVGLAVLGYYREQLRKNREELNRLYAPVEEQGQERLDLLQVAEAHARRQLLLSEIVHYRLRQDVKAGYKRCYRYMREAALSGDLLLYLQVEVEMQAFLIEQDPQGEKVEFDGVKRDLFLWEMVLRGVAKARTNQDYATLIDEVKHVRVEAADLLGSAYPANQAALDTWDAYARTFLGKEENYAQAWDLLSGAIERVEAYLKSGRTLSEAELWQAKASLASAYRVRGYLQRTRSLMQRAIEDYRRAAALLREIDLRVELAITLNDMGFAMSEIGQWADARALVMDALELRRYLGLRAPVGLSINTLARIHLREGNYTAAAEYAERALGLFRAISDRRGVGLALIALAEAQRRYAKTLPMTTAEEQVNLLRAARNHAEEALVIFKELNMQSRQVEALIELGCASRDWLRVRRLTYSPRDDIRRLLDDGERSLREAADLAGNLLYLKMDALVNLAWLGYYAEKPELLQSAAAEADQSIGAEYRIQPGAGKPAIEPEKAQVLVWPQLGKLYMLHGHQAFEDYKNFPSSDRSGCQELLQTACENYFWGLQYSSQYSKDYTNIRMIKDEVYERIKTLHASELGLMARQVKKMTATFKIESPVILEFLQNRALWYGD